MAVGRTSASSRDFRRAIAMASARPTVTPRPVGAIVGIEHEFRVRLHGRVVDFRRVIHDLPIDGLRIDAADPDAYRTRSGGKITADGREAEIATAPIAAGPGIAGRVAAGAAVGAEALRAVLPPGMSLEGYSTHLSVQVPADRAERVAERVMRHFVPALTMLLDGPVSPGLLIRPRPGRVEIGGDFVDGPGLGVAAVVALGAVRASARAATRYPLARRRLPPAIAVRPEAARERYGWFVGDAQLGAGLHADGCTAVLPLADGRRMTAADHLRRAWQAARAELGDLDETTLRAVDVAVEAIASGLAPSAIADVASPSGASSDTDARAWAAAMHRRSRPGFEVEPILASWDFVVVRLRSTRRVAYACLPRDTLGDALTALDGGRLDQLLGAFLNATGETSGETLRGAAQTTTAGLYRGIGRAADLLGPERDPTGGGGKRRRQRHRDRDEARSQPPTTSADRPNARHAARGAAVGAAGLAIFGVPVTVAAAGAGVVGVAVIGGALLLGGGGGGGSAARSAGPRSSSSAIAAASVAASLPAASLLPSASAPTTVPSALASIGTASVDLTVTGQWPAVLKGTAGCGRAQTSGGAPTFFWSAGERDYPGIYDGIQIAEAVAPGGNTIEVKRIIRGPITYVNAAPIPYTGDGHTVTLDTDLIGDSGTDHLAGTITCP